MKIKFSRFIFALSICFIFFNFTHAQKNAVALKFDEFDDSSDTQFYPYEDINLSQRIARLVKQLKKERGAKKVYIIYYLARQINDGEIYKIRNRADRTQSEVANKAGLDYEDVVMIDGGYREKNTLEYWIAPKNAAPPKPTPTFDKSETFVCPQLWVNGEGRAYAETKLVQFSVSKSDAKAEPAYQWTISAGEIVSGQGTSQITVDLKNANNRHVTAFVEASGLPRPCQKVFYSTVDVDVKIYPFDSGTLYNYSELSARLDGFIMELNNNPAANGYIIIYAGRSGGFREMERAIRSVKNVFRFRKFDINRITIIRGGFRDADTFDSWILLPGVEPPKPTPTVDNKFIDVPKSPKNSRKRK